ncbi:hypothetical protein EWM64_g1950 [Hericium alpestre]|uniref:Uncharacterized protein n=1 Tax=Hericium alpestre TaxID=135208 RepID=A0A4Z0A804_9AGAM|nr:hypothetical protein EWM64_g1950 [Hericium alpestre]
MVSSGLDLKTEFSLKPLGSHADSVLLGQRLWDHLVSPTDQRRRISIAITVPQSNSFRLGSAKSFTCWGYRIDESVDGLIIPSEWKELLPSSSKTTCTVQLIDLVCLDDVVVQALSPEAFELAKTQAIFLEDWFCLDRRILRHGSCYIVDTVATNGMTDGRQSAEGEWFKYRIVDMQPATYGYAEKAHTRFLLLPPSEHEHDIDEEDLTRRIPLSEDMTLEEDVEISQDFLAGSLMSCAPIHVSATTSDMHNHTSSTPGPSSSFFPQSFSAVPLVGRVDKALYDYTVFIRTSDLTRVGLLDGDWVSGNR